jgi:hypothetical protein
MIPDDTIIFNHCGAPRNFDDYEVRLRHLLQQDDMPTIEAGRHLLSVCPICKHPWFKAGRQEYPRLTLEQLAFLGAALHVDIHSPHLLPKAFCPICSAVYLGGMFSVEEYPQREGYRFLWESASSRHLRLLALVFRRAGRTLDGLVPLSLEPVRESLRDMHSVLAWLEMCPFPETIRAYPEEQCQHLARRYPSGSAADGRVHQWQGYAWDTFCPPLGGDVQVSLAVALPPSALAPFTSLLLSWNILARAIRAVL